METLYQKFMKHTNLVKICLQKEILLEFPRRILVEKNDEFRLTNFINYVTSLEQFISDPSWAQDSQTNKLSTLCWLEIVTSEYT